ncbi:Six-hairpin glycosidase [Bimuria novae-zelandiae CBS 107.79]|uniref:Six-hairpin glycosidase n=1 Tax=Bimuria novae-zelandiae CBS 107.79 TaxID=1447943 RepID=A0A6A5VCV2_9PLEO|nr:Six-hairpin glycosidase [Bimuria novae-zelandiae CBS 107.79]
MRVSTLLLTGATAVNAAPNASDFFSTWMASSFIGKKHPIDNHYVSNVINEGIRQAATVHNNATLLSWASNAISSLVTADGTIQNWDPTFYSLDDQRVGNNILYFWNLGGRKEKKYEIAAASLRAQLDRFPRNAEGGFWHRSPTYPNQMWLDGIYMADQFYATYTSYFQPDNTTAWNDIVLQFDLIEKHTRNKTSGLLAHGYDGSNPHKAVWADPVTGASPNVWDRAVGWYFIALLETLQVYPTALPGYARLKTYFTTLAAGLLKAQDKASGGWWLVMNEPYPGKPGNYIESSGTAMFTYGFLKGIRLGLLGKEYKAPAAKAYKLLTEKFISYEKNGTLSWEGTVSVGSLNSNASYEYYIGVPLGQNDGKGAGAFMMAAAEYERL